MDKRMDKETHMADRGVRRRRVLLSLCVTLLLAGCGKGGPRPGEVLDEASRAGRTAASFPAAAEDYFHDMDGGGSLTREEIQGRNTWIVWTGGNDRFWDGITVSSFGLFDLLKIVSSHPDKSMEHLDRNKRWVYLGLVNEPCFDKPTGPDPKRYGLWLDKRRADCPPDPFENEQRYPGVRIGARGANVPVGSYYGYASGIVGLRLFPNPDFDEAAAKNWDPVRYYTDEKYYDSKDLVRPYRVGMSCAFCHVGPSPTKPPADPENPKWENLASNVGAQYFWVDRIFSWRNDRRNYMYQLLHTSRPGALDTSLVSTDYINNPRTMNAVYQLGPRLQVGKRWGKEKLAGGGLNNSQFNDYVKDGPLTEFFEKPDTVWTPRVLKDGSDSVGALGALNRVYLNIGLFSEEWLLHFKPLVGGKPISPIEIGVARKNSDLLARHRGSDAQHGALLPQDGGAPPSEGRSRRRRLSDQGPGPAPARQGRVRRAVRPLPLEQGARAGGRRRPRRLRRVRLSRLLDSVLGVDQDRRVQAEDAADRARRQLPRR